MVQVFEFTMKPNGQEGFMHFAQKFAEAARTTNWPIRFEWNALVSGAAGTTHFVVVPMAGFSAFDAEGGDPFEMLVEAYGPTEARQLFASFADVFDNGSTRVWVLRPDLSYSPN